MDSQDDFRSTSEDEQPPGMSELSDTVDPDYRRMMEQIGQETEAVLLKQRNAELMDEIRGLEAQNERLRAKCSRLQKEVDDLNERLSRQKVVQQERPVEEAGVPTQSKPAKKSRTKKPGKLYTFPEDLETITKKETAQCDDSFTAAEVPDSVTRIEKNAFRGKGAL